MNMQIKTLITDLTPILLRFLRNNSSLLLSLLLILRPFKILLPIAKVRY